MYPTKLLRISDLLEQCSYDYTNGCSQTTKLCQSSNLSTELKIMTFPTIYQVRNVDHKEGHHGSPGIVMKYSFSPISAVVQVKERRPWIIFLSRLLGVVGGIISTSGNTLRLTSYSLCVNVLY